MSKKEIIFNPTGTLIWATGAVLTVSNAVGPGLFGLWVLGILMMISPILISILSTEY